MIKGCDVFFFNDTATTEIYTLSLHDALPILTSTVTWPSPPRNRPTTASAAPQSRSLMVAAFIRLAAKMNIGIASRSEEHTSELQSRQYLVCRLLLEKKNTSNTRMFLFLQDKW